MSRVFKHHHPELWHTYRTSVSEGNTRSLQTCGFKKLKVWILLQSFNTNTNSGWKLVEFMHTGQSSVEEAHEHENRSRSLWTGCMMGRKRVDSSGADTDCSSPQLRISDVSVFVWFYEAVKSLFCLCAGAQRDLNLNLLTSLLIYWVFYLLHHVTVYFCYHCLPFSLTCRLGLS